MQSVDFENELTFHTHQQKGTEAKFHGAYEDAVESVKGELGSYHPLKIDGQDVETDDQFAVESPGDVDLTIGEFAAGGATEVDDAVDAAKNALPAWEGRDPSSRGEIFTTAAGTEVRVRSDTLPREREEPNRGHGRRRRGDRLPRVLQR